MRHNSTLQILLFSAILAFALPCQEGKIIQDIHILGLKHTKKEVVERELINRIGKTIQLQRIEQEVRQWESLDLFANISHSCHANDNGTVDLKYQFVELFQYLPAPALKQTDQDGWMAGGALAALNLGGWDIRTEVQARFTIEPWMQAQEYALYASSPYLFHFPIRWKFDYVDVDSWDPLRNYYEKSHNIALETEVPMRNTWSLKTVSGHRILEHKKQDSLQWISARSEQNPFVGVGFIWDSRDSRVNPQKGISSEWLVTKTGLPFTNAEQNWEWLWDFEWNQKVASGTLKLGNLFRNRFGTTAFYSRYHQGGANTLRGFYPDTSIHGKSENIWNAEWRKNILPKVHIHLLDIHAFASMETIFGIDAGWLWNDEFPKWNEYRWSIYTGLHLVVPALERIRFEIGYIPDDKKWGFTIGMFEKRTTQRWRSR